jgi:hypothetical protein
VLWEYDIKFFVLIRGALTPPPRMDVPVMKMPLEMSVYWHVWGYHAAPMTERPMSNPMPSRPHEYGLVSVRNFPGENCSPAPVNNMSTKQY